MNHRYTIATLSVALFATQALSHEAQYDTTLLAPACAGETSSCDSGALLVGRAEFGPEPHAPNTLANSCADGTSGSDHGSWGDQSLDRLLVTTLDDSPLAAGKTVRVDATVWADTTLDALDLYYAADASSPSWVFIATLSPTMANSQVLSTTYELPQGGTRQAIRGVFRYGGSAAPCGSGSYDDRDDLVFPVAVPADTQPPTVSVTSPTDWSTVGGNVTVQANAADDVGVARVEFYAQPHTGGPSTLIGSDTTAPYSVVWNAPQAAGSYYLLTARAFDFVGNETVSSSIVVKLSNTSTGPGTGAFQAAYSSTWRTPACGSPNSSCDSGSLLLGRAGLGPEANAPNTLGGTCADGPAGMFHSDESIDRLQLSTLDGGNLRAGAAVRVDATVWAYGSADVLDIYYASSAASPTWTFAGSVTPTTSGQQTLSVSYTLPAGSTTQVVRGVFRYYGTRSSCASGAYDDNDDLVFTVE